MGLFEDLPDATDAGGKVEGTSAKTPGKDGSAVAAAGGWSGAGSKLRAPTRRPPASLPSAHALKAQAAALRAQQAKRLASLASNAAANEPSSRWNAGSRRSARSASATASTVEASIPPNGAAGPARARSARM